MPSLQHPPFPKSCEREINIWLLRLLSVFTNLLIQSTCVLHYLTSSLVFFKTTCKFKFLPCHKLLGKHIKYLTIHGNLRWYPRGRLKSHWRGDPHGREATKGGCCSRLWGLLLLWSWWLRSKDIHSTCRTCLLPLKPRS